MQTPEFSSKTFASMYQTLCPSPDRIIHPHHCQHLNSCTKKYSEPLSCGWTYHAGKTKLLEEQYFMVLNTTFFFHQLCTLCSTCYHSQKKKKKENGKKSKGKGGGRGNIWNTYLIVTDINSINTCYRVTYEFQSSSKMISQVQSHTHITLLIMLKVQWLHSTHN
jgi:hypothetical protein